MLKIFSGYIFFKNKLFWQLFEGHPINLKIYFVKIEIHSSRYYNSTDDVSTNVDYALCEIRLFFKKDKNDARF